MAKYSTLLLRTCLTDLNILSKSVCLQTTKTNCFNFYPKCEIRRNFSVRLLSSNYHVSCSIQQLSIVQSRFSYCDKVQNKVDEKPPSLYQRLKQLMKDYWYIVIPVHLITSLGWGTLFYFCSKNGLDFVHIMSTLNFNEKYINMVKSSNAGHWVMAYTMYKIATPARYTVTLGGTTFTVRYLNRWGYLKLNDTKEMFKKMDLKRKEKGGLD